MGHGPDDRLARGPLPPARPARLLRDPLRQPRSATRPTSTRSRRRNPSARDAAPSGSPTRSPTWPPTASDCSTSSASTRSRRRRLDRRMIAQLVAARHRSRAVARLDHVQHRQPLKRPAAVPDAAVPRSPSAGRQAGLRPADREVSRSSLARIRARRAGSAELAELSYNRGPARPVRPPDRGVIDSGSRSRTCGRSRRRRSWSTGPRTCWCGRRAARPRRAPSRRPAAEDRGHRPRPARRRLAADHRRDRVERLPAGRAGRGGKLGRYGHIGLRARRTSSGSRAWRSCPARRTRVDLALDHGPAVDAEHRA